MFEELKKDNPSFHLRAESMDVCPADIVIQSTFREKQWLLLYAKTNCTSIISKTDPGAKILLTQIKEIHL